MLEVYLTVKRSSSISKRQLGTTHKHLRGGGADAKKNRAPLQTSKNSGPTFCHERNRKAYKLNFQFVVIFSKAPPFTKVNHFKGPLFASGPLTSVYVWSLIT